MQKERKGGVLLKLYFCSVVLGCNSKEVREELGFLFDDKFFSSSHLRKECQGEVGGCKSLSKP